MNTAPQESSEHTTGQEPAVDDAPLHPATQKIPGSNSEGNIAADSPGPTGIKSHVRNAMERFQGILFQNLPRRGLSTGLSQLDDMSNGLERGRVYVIAARPSMGKTSLLLQILAEVCLNQHIPSLLFTGDLTIPQVTERLILNRAMMAQCSLYNPEFTISKGDLQRIQQRAKELATSGLVLDDMRDMTIEAITAKAREEHAKTGIGLIVIDHLHLIRSESSQHGTSRKREMAGVICALRNLACELGLPILVSAHLKRRAAGRVPRSGDIRESGAIEHEADFIGLIHRDRPILHENCFHLLIAKNNNGPLGTVGLLFIEEIQRFEEGYIISNVPGVPDVSDEEQEVTQAWRDYRNEKEFPR